MSVWVQSADQTRQEACVVLQDMLSEVGITVSVEPMDGTVMDDTIVKGGDFDACSSMYYNLMGDADYVLYSNISPESTSNLSHYNNPDVMAKLLAARSLTDDANALPCIRKSAALWQLTGLTSRCGLTESGGCEKWCLRFPAESDHRLSV